MPIVEVTHGPAVDDAVLRRLAQVLRHAVSVAVACPEEPYDGVLRPGDVELRFRAVGPHDVTGFDLLVEVRSKWFASRAADRQHRVDGLRTVIADVVAPLGVGVYLSLPVAAWSQTD